LANKYPTFKESERLLPYFHNPVTGPNPEPAETSPQCHTKFLTYPSFNKDLYAFISALAFPDLMTLILFGERYTFYTRKEHHHTNIEFLLSLNFGDTFYADYGNVIESILSPTVFFRKLHLLFLKSNIEIHNKHNPKCWLEQ